MIDLHDEYLASITVKYDSSAPCASGGLSNICTCIYTVLVLLRRDFVGNIMILSYAILQHFVVLDD